MRSQFPLIRCARRRLPDPTAEETKIKWDDPVLVGIDGNVVEPPDLLWKNLPTKRSRLYARQREEREPARAVRGTHGAGWNAP
ncbi:hypothetical protein [Parafrankia sp. BMG5.11]|uniref:hypothetical protein n=1 Tax=Parafrankia sp. BMG5.11 TaxID=222540 RepID=UPI000DA568F6|nr:hypothetical protein [Parafrankia sp. BMG5.11]TCJ34012.1 hypothetical protein E0504_35445 [Parafrankia sp. BMG5.11]SQD94327.1 hypothetical protein FMEAI12_2470010 [Parafrankia sp. Ea1.12]